MSSRDVPEWAVDRALERFPRPFFIDGESWKSAVMEGRDVLFANAVRFLAQEIEHYEEPPVDPLLMEAREIVRACYPEMSENYSGRGLTIAVDALRRGMELAKAGAS